MPDPPDKPVPTGERAQFPETRWTLVEAVRAGGAAREQALNDVCRRYWFPLYAWLRRSGHSHADAEDLVQSFLARITSGEALNRLDREGSRLRSWLLHLLKNHAISAWRRERSLRRGGNHPHAGLGSADQRYAAIADAAGSPDETFDRQWALGILGRAIEALRSSYAEGGQEAWFAALQPALLQTGAHVGFAAIGESLGITENLARVTAFRMRKQLRQLIEDEILFLSGGAESAKQELEVFRAALSR
ncbi:MAG: sigma-70 family RNA polymerase sigma factor [Verrucomicrobiales bacterium]